ncbi:MAG: ribosomal-processing cysteine protease Prp [Candidatus Eremiobacteraeota bacterium]|nr:ribosomal-processing cysteine protease Prp [Candidatus Eremiobacteraeota bacterium]
MLSLRLRSNALGEIIAINARGHMGTADYGKDLACVAASVLLQNTAFILSETGCLSGLEITPGALKLRLKRNLSFSQEVPSKILMQSLLEGLENLRKSYPGNLKFKFEGRRQRLWQKK